MYVRESTKMGAGDMETVIYAQMAGVENGFRPSLDPLQSKDSREVLALRL